MPAVAGPGAPVSTLLLLIIALIAPWVVHLAAPRQRPLALVGVIAVFLLYGIFAENPLLQWEMWAGLAAGILTVLFLAGGRHGGGGRRALVLAPPPPARAPRTPSTTGTSRPARSRRRAPRAAPGGQGSVGSRCWAMSWSARSGSSSSTRPRRRALTPAGLSPEAMQRDAERQEPVRVARVEARRRLGRGERVGRAVALEQRVGQEARRRRVGGVEARRRPRRRRPRARSCRAPTARAPRPNSAAASVGVLRARAVVGAERLLPARLPWRAGRPARAAPARSRARLAGQAATSACGVGELAGVHQLPGLGDREYAMLVGSRLTATPSDFA